MPLQFNSEPLITIIKDGILERATTGKKSLRKLIIHCSASEFGDAEQIDSWHVQRGFAEIGYHFVVLNGRRQKNSMYKAEEDGYLERGRPLGRYGAHTTGHNDDSIGLCLIGNAEKIEANPTLIYTYDQIDTLKTFILAWHNATGLDIYTSVYGHNDFTEKKICPCFDVSKWLKYNDFVKL